MTMKTKKNSQSNQVTDLNFENDVIKAKLTAEFGMKKLNSDLNPEVENEWLNYINSQIILILI